MFVFAPELVHTATKVARLKSAMARLEKEFVRTGLELVLAVAIFCKKLTLFTMFSSAGLFARGGLYGLPGNERLLSGIGPRNEHVTRRESMSVMVSGS
jgi:hypothetical protein